jgi:DNA-binding response OmpR family regulator
MADFEGGVMSGEVPPLLTDRSSIRILIVEDRRDHADLLQAWLEPVGCQLQVVRSEEAALAALKQDPPDLVVLDLMLCKDNADAERPRGYDVCRRLRADPRTAQIPVLMFTVLDQLEYIERGVEVDADDYLVKDSPPAQVRFRVESLLRVRGIKNKADRMIAYLRLLEEGPGETPGPPSPGGM